MKRNRTQKVAKTAAPRAATPASPAPDLAHKRQEFVDTFIKKGVEFVEELIRENDRLRGTLREAEDRNRSLRSQLESDDAIRDLLQRITTLEKERELLKTHTSLAAPPTDSYASRYAELEAQLNNLANLYIASYQLHSTLDLPEVVRNLRELLHQLVGARSFAVYLGDGTGESLSAIVAQGAKIADLPAIPLGEGPIGRAFLTGETFIAESATQRAVRSRGGGLGAPLACVPMRVGVQIVGVIAVFDLLEQKEGFADVDHELFKLLGANAATALVGAQLYAKSKGERVTAEGTRSLL